MKLENLQFIFKDPQNHTSELKNSTNYQNSNINGPTCIHIPLRNGTTPTDATTATSPTSHIPINITQEVNRTTIWQQVNKNGNSEQLIIPINANVRHVNGSNL